MPELDSKDADDRILPLTRGIAAVIVPFLLVAFAVLYPWPGDTAFQEVRSHLVPHVG